MLDNTDGNLHALNKHLEEIDFTDTARECFLSEPIINELEELIVQARELAKDYRGYDFTIDLEDIL